MHESWFEPNSDRKQTIHETTLTGTKFVGVRSCDFVDHISLIVRVGLIRWEPK